MEFTNLTANELDYIADQVAAKLKPELSKPKPSESSEPKDDFITVSEAARILRVSRVTIYKRMKEGRLTVYGKGTKHQRLKRSEIERDLKSM